MSDWASDKKMKLLFENFRGFVNEQEEEAPAEAAPPDPAAAEWIAKNIAPLLGASGGDSTAALGALVSRLNSAEGQSDAVRSLLSGGINDGEPGDEVISVKMGVAIPQSQLFPTQGVIDLFKSVGFNGSNAGSLQAVLNGTSGAPPILVAGTGGKYFIVDGHHRWSGASVFNTNVKIPCNVINVAADKALLISQIAIAAWQGGGKKLPSASAKAGRSIIGSGAMSAEDVYNILKENVGRVIDKRSGGKFWNPKVVQVVLESGYGKDMPAAGIPQPPEDPEQTADPRQDLQEFNQMEMAMASDRGLKKVAANCGKLASDHSSDGPPREIMPQFDPKVGGPDFESAVKSDVEDGDINYKAPYVKVAAESKTYNRWKKIIKG
jgi:hypothetical protein